MHFNQQGNCMLVPACWGAECRNPRSQAPQSHLIPMPRLSALHSTLTRSGGSRHTTVHPEKCPCLVAQTLQVQGAHSQGNYKGDHLVTSHITIDPGRTLAVPGGKKHPEWVNMDVSCFLESSLGLLPRACTQELIFITIFIVESPTSEIRPE